MRSTDGKSVSAHGRSISGERTPGLQSNRSASRGYGASANTKTLGHSAVSGGHSAIGIL